MRSQVPNQPDQSSGVSDQKKSVFDRLGRQLEGPSGSQSMKRRPSPGQYGDYMPPPPPPPPTHEADFGRYQRDPHSQAEYDWRYQNERRHMMGPSFGSRGDNRHTGQSMPPGLQPSGPPGPPTSHYDMDMPPGRQPPYYPGSHHNPYHNAGLLPGPTSGPGMAPGERGMLSMGPIHHQSSPKYDRHGNLIRSGPGGPMRLEHHGHGISPPNNFMPSGLPMMHPGPAHEVLPMKPEGGMYLSHRWHENLEPEFPPHMGRMMHEGRFSSMGSRRYQQQQQHHHTQLPPGMDEPPPRYTKWRERRDVITNLDRETAQSSSRTDSLKSSLQQPDSRSAMKVNPIETDQSPLAISTSAKCHPPEAQSTQRESPKKDGPPADKDQSGEKSPSLKSKVAASKTEPQDISDGEIVDDEDSSDDEIDESKRDFPSKRMNSNNSDPHDENFHPGSRTRGLPALYRGSRDPHRYFEPSKKRRHLEREDYAMDYETISDEDLDDFMGDKKISSLSDGDSKICDRLADESSNGGGKSLSEIELLNALGLDWANLVEMSKQSKTSGKEAHQPGSALPRFALPNFLPTLGITCDLAGGEIYDLVLRVCRS